MYPRQCCNCFVSCLVCCNVAALSFSMWWWSLSFAKRLLVLRIFHSTSLWGCCTCWDSASEHGCELEMQEPVCDPQGCSMIVLKGRCSKSLSRTAYLISTWHFPRVFHILFPILNVLNRVNLRSLEYCHEYKETRTLARSNKSSSVRRAHASLLTQWHTVGSAALEPGRCP